MRILYFLFVRVLISYMALNYSAVAEWYEAGLCDREVAGSTPARGCCVPTPTQRAIPPGSVNE